MEPKSVKMKETAIESLSQFSAVYFLTPNEDIKKKEWGGGGTK
jgi:hypothetical protein